MCEFDVYLNGEKVFEEAIRIKREEESGDLILNNVIGREKNLGNVRIMEVNVSSEKLVLAE